MKNLQLSFVVLIFIISSCEKEVQPPGDMPSHSDAHSEGLFKEEIIVTDQSGKNQAFYAIYSDDKELLSEYLETTKLSLKVNKHDIQKLKSSFSSDQYQLKSGATSDTLDLTKKPKITVSLVKTNMQNNVDNFSLKIEKSNKKSTNFITGDIVAYETFKDFIGIVHRGNGYKNLVQFRYKKNWYSLSWDFLETSSGGNTWQVYPNGTYYRGFTKNPNSTLTHLTY